MREELKIKLNNKLISAILSFKKQTPIIKGVKR